MTTRTLSEAFPWLGDDLQTTVGVFEPHVFKPALAIEDPARVLGVDGLLPAGLRLVEPEDYCQAVLDLFYDGEVAS